MTTDKKISELPVISAVAATDVSVLVHNGANYQFDFTTLLQFINSGINPGASILFGTTLPQNTTGKNGDIFINTVAGSFAQKQSGTWLVKYTLPVNNGADGTVLYGSGVPGTGIGNNNDTYINIDTGIFYHKATGTWVQVFSMQTGPQGSKGDKGDTGTTGVAGKTILNGTSNPSNSTTGTNGDFYLNTSTYQLFGPKTDGTWGSGTSIVGLPGEQGETGAQGPPGAAGAGVATGGATGQVLSKVSDADFDTEWVDQTGGGDSNAIEIVFGTTLAFDNDKYMSTNQTGAISFMLAPSGNILGKTISAKIVGDSAHTITFDAAFKILSGTVDNTKTNYLYFNYVAADDVRVTISFEGGTSGSGGGAIIGGDLANGKIPIGDATNKAKAVTPSGDMHIDLNGVTKIANSLSVNSVGNNQVVFRDYLGDLKGSDSFKFAPDTGFNSSTFLDKSTVSGAADYIGNLFKSKIRTADTDNSGTQTAWQFEADLKQNADSQHMTALWVKAKLDKNGFDPYVDYFRVTDVDALTGVEKDVVRYATNLATGKEYFKIGAGFTFHNDNGYPTIYTGSGFQVVGGIGNDPMIKADYLGIRAMYNFRVGSSSPANEMFRVDAEVSTTKAAVGIKQGSYSEYYQLNGKIDAGSTTPIKLYEFLTSRGDASGFYVIEVTGGAWTNNGASSTIVDTAYWILSTGVSADTYGDGTLAFTNGVATNTIKAEKSSGAADWDLYFDLDQAGNHIQLFAVSTSANAKYISFTANIKVTWITYQ